MGKGQEWRWGVRNIWRRNQDTRREVRQGWRRQAQFERVETRDHSQAPPAEPSGKEGREKHIVSGGDEEGEAGEGGSKGARAPEVAGCKGCWPSVLWHGDWEEAGGRAAARGDEPRED